MNNDTHFGRHIVATLEVARLACATWATKIHWANVIAHGVLTLAAVDLFRWVFTLIFEGA